jgi:hypothetical protein
MHITFAAENSAERSHSQHTGTGWRKKFPDVISMGISTTFCSVLSFTQFVSDPVYFRSKAFCP